MKTNRSSHRFQIFLSFFLLVLICSACSAVNSGPSDLTRLQIDTKQCLEPWLSANGDTLQEKVSNYLKGIDIQIEGFENLSENTAVCLACEVCAGPSVIVTVDKKHVNRLEQEGFYIVTQ
ncbi:hypothetical protein U6A24_06885 [Aquimarina gracilis]|uniref:Lipoprotein n=1 Tax=Aquimarina gracilis TaxID=874422 RepID=A0ABU5ZSX0_9FLAO|nr:hypothetical protein [Aquimarina gracilis]MEB3345176.1 hypothetical protein [Aquimarina gracilis]